MICSPFRKRHILAVLEDYSQQNHPADVFLNHYFREQKAIGSKDRALIADTIYQILRWRGLLDHLGQQPSTWETRLSAYQRYFDEKFAYDPNALPPHIKVSFPQELFELFLRHFGLERTEQLCLVSNQTAPTTVRVNILKITRQELLQRWKSHYPVSPCLKSLEGISFEKRGNFFAMEEFQRGLFEVQDESSQQIAQLVEAIPGQHVLDFCAGSGGKSLAIGAHLQNKGQLYLHDVRLHALAQARKRLRRAGIQNIQILPSNHPQWPKFFKKMDWVLVDAPCSGTGTLRRNPDMKWRFQMEKLDQLKIQQREIFSQALQYLSPTGKIVYATCSILPEENGHQVEYFLTQYAIELDRNPIQIFPEKGLGDGFFAAVFKWRV